MGAIGGTVIVTTSTGKVVEFAVSGTGQAEGASWAASVGLRSDTVEPHTSPEPPAPALGRLALASGSDGQAPIGTGARLAPGPRADASMPGVASRG